MTRFLFLLSCLLIPVSVLPQRSGKQTFLLNNGSSLSGIVVGDSSDTYLVKLLVPQIISLPKGSVSSVEKFRTGDSHYDFRGGYYINVAANILAGKSKNDRSVKTGLHLSNGYQFSNGLGIGIGTGIEEMSMILLPVYADLRYHPFNSRISPYTFLKSGYAFSLTDDEEKIGWYGFDRESKGGLILNTGVGIMLYTGERFGVNIGIGYRYQRVTVTETSNGTWSDYSTHYITTYNRFEMQLGFVFR